MAGQRWEVDDFLSAQSWDSTLHLAIVLRYFRPYFESMQPTPLRYFA